MKFTFKQYIRLAIVLLILVGLTFYSGIFSAIKEPDQQFRENTIKEISTVLTHEYVFPKVADEMAKFLNEKMLSGAYDNIDNVSDFGVQLTSDLQSISHDKHLRVFEDEGWRLGNLSGLFRRFQRKLNHGFQEVKVLDGNIGYIDLRAFENGNGAKSVAETAMHEVRNTSALIIDLRKNGGGSPAMIKLLTSYFFDGSEPIHLNSFYWRPTDSYEQFYTHTEINGKRMDDIDLYLLTSSDTFSAAEEFAYNLKNLKRATLVGETTGGGAHPGGTRTIGKYLQMFVPQGRAINPITQSNWEGIGVTPHIEVNDENALDEVLCILSENE